MTDNAFRRGRLFIGMFLLLAAAFVLSVCVGRYTITVLEIIKILTGQPVPNMARQVFWGLRLPRTVMAVLAGMGLGVSGGVYQTVFRNSLASPEIIGVSSGASVGAAFAIVFLGGSTLLIAANAFIGGMTSVLLILLVVFCSGRRDTATYVVAGIIIKAVAQALLMIIKFSADPERQLAPIEFWTMGSLGSITNAKVWMILPLYLAGMGMIFALRWQITMLSVGDDEAAALGVNVRRLRLLALVSATMVISSVISVTGLIVFIGLLSPHISRLILRRGNRGGMLLSGLIGALVLLLSDVVARSVSSAEVPISIITTLLGAPFLVYFLCRRKSFV